MQLRCNQDKAMQFICYLDQFRYSADSAKILFLLKRWVGSKIIPRIRLTSAKVEVEAELVKNPDP